MIVNAARRVRALRFGMRFHTEHLTFNTKQHRQYINITPQVEAALVKSKIREGMILVSAMHITAGVWVNDAEDGLLADIDGKLDFGPWQQVYYAEFDGRRPKRVIIKVMGE